MPSETALALRGAGVGLFATAAALFLLVAILHSIGVLLAWAAVASAVLACIYWARRGAMAVRRHLHGGPAAPIAPGRKWER